MTDPVDTHALRAITRDRADVLSAWEVDAMLAAADEIDWLQATILDQQHDDLCAVWMLNGGTSDEGCTCWKSKALA